MEQNDFNCSVKNRDLKLRQASRGLPPDLHRKTQRHTKLPISGGKLPSPRESRFPLVLRHHVPVQSPLSRVQAFPLLLREFYEHILECQLSLKGEHISPRGQAESSYFDTRERQRRAKTNLAGLSVLTDPWQIILKNLYYLSFSTEGKSPNTKLAMLKYNSAAFNTSNKYHIFISPKGNLLSIKQLPIQPFPYSPETTNTLSICMDLPVLHIACKQSFCFWLLSLRVFLVHPWCIRTTFLLYC